jgi:ATP-dependent HslUV protease ATP-binding subunit HslU
MGAVNLTPNEIVEYLDGYVIGQSRAKRAIALALRTRYRRLLLDESMQKEILPKNILMIGSTGVGKTEISRRMATMMGVPFVKVEASKYTEIGFVGRDVESMVRDLVMASIVMVRREKEQQNEEQIQSYVVHKLADKLVVPMPFGATGEQRDEHLLILEETRLKVASGELDDSMVEIDRKRCGGLFHPAARDSEGARVF